ncbi:hypothetical protein CSB45_05310 [candidate division KSB3 bacterium]|uniref:AB hydrolase-1 domain-containing protein n=1 Tax=candidate division KSB3 bacterium TaxID=2044937 RepID=A0A2G6E7P1_9BACT|nr:MAG: hypothetical protein CSB45_05310 [candidate division KSB3 bacterium]PIE30466.1 MAG: hypothetical protein CSA57_04075 [candidate division KSB3 bacterium]
MPHSVINAINIHYRDQGNSDRRVLVLIHGLGCSLQYWDCLFNAAALSHSRILAIDLPGFGFSEKPEHYDYQLPSQSRLIFDILQRLQIRTFDLVGHSMGGTIAILMALQKPQRVRRLVTIEPNLLATHAQLSRRIAQYTEDAFIDAYEEFRLSVINTVKGWFVKLRQQHVNDYISHLSRTTAISMYRSARSLLQETSEPGLAGALKHIALPRSLILGEESVQMRSSTIPEELRDSSVDTIVVPGVGHMMMVDNPDLFTHTVAQALQ